MIDNQKFESILAKNGVRWLSKVNAAEKFGVDFLFFGVLTETRKGAKNAKKTCTKVGNVCKNQASFTQFFIGRSFPRVPQGSKTTIFRQKLHRHREQNFL